MGVFPHGVLSIPQRDAIVPTGLRKPMDHHWKYTVGRPFTIWTPDRSTVVRVSALETGRGSSTWVWLRRNRLPAGELKPADPARPTTLEETLKSSHVLAASFFALGVGLTVVPTASADDVGTDGSSPGQVVVTPVDPSDNVTDAAAQACGTFAQVLDGSSNYYGEFDDVIKVSIYSDPAVHSINALGMT